MVWLTRYANENSWKVCGVIPTLFDYFGISSLHIFLNTHVVVKSR